MTNEAKALLRAGQGRLDQDCLIFQGLVTRAVPRRGAPVAEQIDGDHVVAVFQVAHQAAPLPGTGHAGMDQDDQRPAPSLEGVNRWHRTDHIRWSVASFPASWRSFAGPTAAKKWRGEPT